MGEEEQADSENAWEDARSAQLTRAKAVEKNIPGYSYSDKTQASRSHERLKLFIAEKLSKSKNRIRDLLSFLYQLQQEAIGGKFKVLEDDIDIFSDEVKVSPFKWKRMSVRFYEHLIERDYFLIKGVKRLNHFLKKLSQEVVSYKQVDDKEFDLDMIKEAREGARKQLRELIILFKEREALFEVEGRDLEEVFQEVREEINQKF